MTAEIKPGRPAYYHGSLTDLHGLYTVGECQCHRPHQPGEPKWSIQDDFVRVDHVRDDSLTPFGGGETRTGGAA